jgi:hypothetical protein
MKVILGSLLVLTGTAVLAVPMLANAYAVPPPPLESGENIQQPLPAAAAAVDGLGAQAAMELLQPPSVILGASNQETSQLNTMADDPVQSPGAASTAAADSHQARKNIRPRVEGSSVRPCNHLGCRGVIVGGIGF